MAVIVKVNPAYGLMIVIFGILWVPKDVLAQLYSSTDPEDEDWT